VSLFNWAFPSAGRIVLDLGPVIAQRGRRELEPLAFLQPLVKELPEGRSYPVRPRWRVLVDQIPERLVGRPSRSTERPGQLLPLPRDRVGPQINPELPNPFLQLPLRTPHITEWYARSWDLSWDSSSESRRASPSDWL
jgi:hypothetical protein